MSMPWFRMYSEWASDPVVQSLSFDDQRHHAVLLCLKCNGTLDRDISESHRERIILRGLGLDPVTAGEVKRRLLEVGLIDERWQPNGWDKRQYTSDISTNRVRKYRNNKESGNVSGTLQETEGNSSGNVPDTEQIQNRTDTEINISDGFDFVWSIYPKRQGANPREKAHQLWKTRLKEGNTVEEMTDGVRRYRNFCAATQKINTEFVMQAKKFFGPDKYFKEPWDFQSVKKANGGRKTFEDYTRDANTPELRVIEGKAERVD